MRGVVEGSVNALLCTLVLMCMKYVISRKTKSLRLPQECSSLVRS